MSWELRDHIFTNCKLYLLIVHNVFGEFFPLASALCPEGAGPFGVATQSDSIEYESNAKTQTIERGTKIKKQMRQEKVLRKGPPLIHKICFFQITNCTCQIYKMYFLQISKWESRQEKESPFDPQNRGSSGVIKGEGFVHSLQGPGQNTGQSCKQISLLRLSYLFWQIQTQNNENIVSVEANMAQSGAMQLTRVLQGKHVHWVGG